MTRGGGHCLTKIPLRGWNKQERLKPPKTFTIEGQNNTETSSTGGRQTLIGLQIAPSFLKLKRHFKMDPSMNKDKIQSIASYAFLGILFQCIEINSLNQWVQQQHMI